MKPTVGRDLHFYPNGGLSAVAHDSVQPLAAKIAYVWNDHMVNLMVIDQNGIPFSKTSVTLCRIGDEVPAHGQYYACWPLMVAQPAIPVKLPGATFAMGSSSTDPS